MKNVGRDISVCASIFQDEIERMNNWQLKNKVKIDVQEIQCMCVNANDFRVIIPIDGELIQWFKKVKYVNFRKIVCENIKDRLPTKNLKRIINDLYRNDI